MTKPTLCVVFTKKASEHVRKIKMWWEANRRAAPDLFADELDGTLAAVASTPTLGIPAPDTRLSGIRRTLLPRARYHVYFRVKDGALEVLAVWHAKRMPPKI